jgi:prepilin-type N-terminal cleavage/methylation domain-containing protein
LIAAPGTGARVESQRGFSLIETLVGSAIAVVIGSLLVWLAHGTIFQAAHLDARLVARTSTDRLADRLAADAASAWSVFVPANDVLGASNADGHELDFASEDASHRTYWWAYRYDPAAQCVVDYAYRPGSPPVAGDVYGAVAGFTAQTHAVTDVTDAASDVYDPLFAAATVTPVDFDYGWGAQALGGNHLVRVDVAATGINRTLLLASATAPTHFTVIVDYTPPPPLATP